eukprot:2854614-Ditylum_brightwellii.AAC.2
MIGDEEIEFYALTCIDPVKNLVQIICIENKMPEHVAQQSENVWLLCYPFPRKFIHDNGGEFIGDAFQQMLQRNGVEEAPTTSCNPQANS